MRMPPYTQQPGAAVRIPEYDAEVNKGSINMSVLVSRLNTRAQEGWRLHTMLEQDGNTIVVYERWTVAAS